MKNVKLFACVLLLLLPGCDSREEKHAKYLERGNALFAREEYAKAKLEYKNAARLSPTDAEALYRLGLVAEAEGDVREAFKNFIAAEQQSARHVPALLKLTQYFLAGGNAEEARKKIEAALVLAPKDPKVRASLAAVHLRLKALAQAEMEARAALAAEPENVLAYTVLTGVYVAREDINKALEIVAEGIAKNPSNLALLLLKGMVCEHGGLFEPLVETYRAILALKPKEARYRNDFAKVYLQAGKKDEAEKTLRDGTTAMPDDWAMKKTLVSFLSDQRGLDAAEAEIEALQKAHPEKEELVFWLADLYTTHKASERAIALLESIVDRSPKDGAAAHSLNARATLARLRFFKGEKALAEKLVATILEKNPDHRDALLIKAQTLVEKGAYQDAVSILRTLVRDRANDVDALGLLGESLLSQGYTDLALDTFAQLVQVAPANVPAKVRLAQIYGLSGEPARAKELLTLVTKLAPEYPVGWESVARVALEEKDWPNAERAIAKLETLEGQSRLAAFLRAQSAAAQKSFDAALGHIKKAVGNDPSAPIAERALTLLLGIQTRRGAFDEAANYVLGLERQTAFTAALLGECYAKAGQSSRALEFYDKAIGLGAQTVEPYLVRARLYMADKDAEKALAVLQKAQEAAPDDVRAALLRADVLGSLGKDDDALAVYDELLARRPTLDVAANNAAQMLADRKANDHASLEKARVLAERFVRSSNPYFLDTLGWVYFRQGKFEQAQTLFERIMSMKEKLPATVHYHYSALLARTGREKEALVLVRKLLEDQGPFEGRAQAEALAATLEKK